MDTKPYMSQYAAGIILGIVLLVTFVVTGRGLGASGAMMNNVVAIEKVVAQDHVDNNFYLASYGKSGKNPLNNWLVFEVIGIMIGGAISGFIGGRIKIETNHGPNISDKGRWAMAILGGVLFGYGARLARGCTSGVALSGGATLAIGSWITMMAIFAGAFAMAYFIKKQWI